MTILTQSLVGNKPDPKECECGGSIEAIVKWVSLDKAEWIFPDKCRDCRMAEEKKIEEQAFESQRKDRIQSLIPRRYINADMAHITNQSVVGYMAEKGYLEKRGLFLCGGVGSGKTFTACAMAKRLISDGLDIEFWNLPNLLDLIRSDIQEKNDSLKRAESCQVLFLDDMGVERPTEWVLETLYKVINNRYEDEKPVIYTSNLKYKDLALRVGDRIVSRIMGSCLLVDFGNKDRRTI